MRYRRRLIRKKTCHHGIHSLPRAQVISMHCDGNFGGGVWRRTDRSECFTFHVQKVATCRHGEFFFLMPRSAIGLTDTYVLSPFHPCSPGFPPHLFHSHTAFMYFPYHFDRPLSTGTVPYPVTSFFLANSRI